MSNKNLQIYNGWICPATASLLDIGTSLKPFKDMYMSGAIYGSADTYIDFGSSGGYLDLVSTVGIRVFGDIEFTGTIHATGYYLNTHTITDDYDALLTDDVIFCDSQSGNAEYTITLPSATTCDGKIFIVKTLDIGSAETITIEAQSGEFIDDGSTIDLTADYTTYRLISNGVDWYLI